MWMLDGKKEQKLNVNDLAGGSEGAVIQDFLRFSGLPVLRLVSGKSGEMTAFWMEASKLPSLCFQFPPALSFFLFSSGSDEEEFVDVPDDTDARVYVTAAELSSLERRCSEENEPNTHWVLAQRDRSSEEEGGSCQKRCSILWDGFRASRGAGQCLVVRLSASPSVGQNTQRLRWEEYWCRPQLTDDRKKDSLLPPQPTDVPSQGDLRDLGSVLKRRANDALQSPRDFAGGFLKEYLPYLLNSAAMRSWC
ncbi:unnamed protein product [Pleuronectes platessa]|uniref:Uncharacterized protein n=1 Tax=Pleuronectes platessa TaxID=8262 RepID=A0A9N7TNA8_PLEPL|nr:unnamed protein product [Pleuronectes platessa]